MSGFSGERAGKRPEEARVPSKAEEAEAREQVSRLAELVTSPDTLPHEAKVQLATAVMKGARAEHFATGSRLERALRSTRHPNEVVAGNEIVTDIATVPDLNSAQYKGALALLMANALKELGYKVVKEDTPEEG